MSISALTIAVATPLPSDLVEPLMQCDPRLLVDYRPHLLLPQRWVGDWGGDTSVTRTDQEHAEYVQMLTHADILLGIPDSSARLLREVVEHNPRLRWVHTMAAGGGAQVKSAGLSEDDLQRVTFTTSAGVHGTTLAEFALFGLLAGAKDLPRLHSDQRAHHWPDRYPMRHLSEMTILIMGTGGIGRVVAHRLHALGATVWATSRSGTPVEGVERLIAMDDLHDALGQCDGLVITLPGTSATRHMIDAAAFASMKPGMILVNVGRGTVIDEGALVDALNGQRVAFAALDVTETEPLQDDSALWDHPRVLISPHTAALSTHEGERIVELFMDNAVRFLNGRPLRNVVNTIEFY